VGLEEGLERSFNVWLNDRTKGLEGQNWLFLECIVEVDLDDLSLQKE